MDPPNRILLRSSETENTGPDMGIILGRALAMDCRKVVIATDLAKSSAMMKEALVAGLLSAGVDVIDIGAASGPAVGMAASKGDCAVYVTECQRPGSVSGYLLMNSDGSLFRKDQIRHLDKIFIEPMRMPGNDGLGRVYTYDNAVREYNARLQGLIDRCPGCSVVLDCKCGPVSESAPVIVGAVGADVMTLNAQIGRGCASQDPGEEGTDESDAKEIVMSNPGCIGIAMNRIGTVATVVDEKGETLSHDQTFAIIVAKVRPASIAVPINTSLVILDAFRDLPEGPERRAIFTDNEVGAVCSAVAEGAEMGYCEGGAIYGGTSLMPDGIRTAAIMAAIAGNDSLNRLAEGLTECYRSSKTIDCECTADAFARAMDAGVREAAGEVHTADCAWRVDMEDGWFLISLRKGEPLTVGIDAESRDRAYILGLMEIAERLAESCARGS